MSEDQESGLVNPIFPGAAIRLVLGNMRLEDIGRIRERQRSALTAQGVAYAGSFVCFEFDDATIWYEQLGDNTSVHIFEGDVPGISGEYSRDEHENSVWRIHVALTSDEFLRVQRLVNGYDPRTGERGGSALIYDVIQIIGRQFQPMNPDDPSDVSFEGLVYALFIGDWHRE